MYDYDKYGDSPACLGKDEDYIENQKVLFQGFGITPDGTSGELLELELNTITNEQCYEKFSDKNAIGGENYVHFPGTYAYCIVY